MERIEVKGNYNNTRLLRESRNHTIDIYDSKGFNNLNTMAVVEIVNAQAELYEVLATMRDTAKKAKELNNIELIEQIKAGKITAVVSFDTYRLDPVEVVATIA